ncbi:antitoxin component YwqK of YwqJK toxin-antitoxin module [Ulvibacter sp. MAR_2010_11]|uniref:toxin-antitoxin system YwqK family antitoxin n=1 Tax=Ulvibacter sp. MAR_2010_11 TaxID=1250229 RepID=UPI000C2CE106|nr:toxin-antitoxin system YwqK family antitoxin [Ulvibacter sp. MAR_2010_11]PKA83724.1 antitoxin component YwqK of YwqJK toxin-antitoxin module [Ulvibacter sp. MAR_2010_11]
MRISHFMFFTAMLTCSVLLSQNDINQNDAQGKRHGIWKKYFPGTKQLRYEGSFEHGKEVGTFKFYCEECGDKPTAVKEYKSGDKFAYVKYYTIKGKLVSEGKMDEKDREGEWVYYHKKSNEVMTRENYVDGKLDGKKITYYTNGKITEEQTYKNGIMEGENNFYSPEGVLIKKLKYRNDQLQGEATYFDAHGNVVIEGFYKDGQKHGLWKYFKNGKLEFEETYPKPLKKAN